MKNQRTPILETLYPNWGQYFKDWKGLVRQHTGNQELLLIDTPDHGKVLLLDGIVQLTEVGHHSYHEMMVHPALFAHPNPKNILIIGGGDGGVAREILRHSCVKSVTMIEIDQAVIDFSCEHFPDVSAGAFEDQRLEVIIADGAQFVQDTPAVFDVILVDSTDPIEGLSDVLFTSTFYADCRARLSDAGSLVIQNGVPRRQAGELESTMLALRQAGFRKPTCYLVDAPDYVGGQMAFGWASNFDYQTTSAQDDAVHKVAMTPFIANLAYFNAEIMSAAFALPNYVNRLLTPQSPI